MKFAIIALICCLSAQSHEIGTTRVMVQFQPNGTYDIEIITDASSLSEKLRGVPGDPLSIDQLKPALIGFEQKFRQRIKVSFDGTEVHPAISYQVTPPIDATSAIAASIRLTGEIPANAAKFTWSYGWTFSTYALAIRTPSSPNPTAEWLEGGQSSAAFALGSLAQPVDRLTTAWLYLKLGFTHILPEGIDHLLFVLGIYLLSGRIRNVLWQVSAFTLAHSITLGLSMYGIVSVSPRIVEPLIALSIAYVAIENIFLSELKSWRVGLVFLFGLLHGMGFAGALKELGLPRSEFVTALVTFNLGVEAAQLTVIATAFLLLGWHWSNRNWYRGRVVIPASAMIACMAVYWTVERMSL